LLQVRIGNGGGNGVKVGGLRPGAIFSSIADPSNWIYVAAIAVLLVIGVVLIVMVIREFKLPKKKK
jgi:hypothetical protein